MRGTSGNRPQPGLHGVDIDPHGPAPEVVGDADPRRGLWFHGNPMWVWPA
ncbi:hypothetical protein [Streptomyces sp. ST2-7A]|nr:hypothetical protein [Streptomyces sp. ST2-7A]MCE7082662.1 hypothetical protein [Streptomyces sp. ST2-7A]